MTLKTNTQSCSNKTKFYKNWCLIVSNCSEIFQGFSKYIGLIMDNSIVVRVCESHKRKTIILITNCNIYLKLMLSGMY